jgi:hypothetical protein
MDAELERFKSEISLVDLAQAEYGYELIKRESSAASKVLVRGDDKLVVTRQQDAHDVYFSVVNARDCGSVVDFVQRRKAVNLGQVRKELRQWLPGSRRPSPRRPARAPERAVVTSADRADVLRRWASMRPYSGAYLTAARGIDPQLVAAFGVREDDHGNACIAHRDEFGVVGWEAKNQGFTGFAAGGTRNVSLTRLDAGPMTQLVVTEAAIDAMSWAQLKHTPGTAYLSTGGAQLSQAQRAQLQRIFATSSVPIVLAMDRDAAGEKMAHELVAMAPAGLETVRDMPTVGKDWNESLQASEARHEYDQGGRTA